MAGFIRFALFLAVIGIFVLGYYARTLSVEVSEQRAAVAALAKERDDLKIKAEDADKRATEGATALQQAQAKVTELEAQIEAAKKTPARRR